MKLYSPTADGLSRSPHQPWRAIKHTPPLPTLTRSGSAAAGSRSSQPLHQSQTQRHISIRTMAESCAATTHAPYLGMNRTAVVVGGGPAGCLAAMLLAKQGWQVHVMEMRDMDSSVGSRSRLRSWAIAIFTRGIDAILAAVPGAGDFFRARSYEALVLNRADGSVRWRMQRKEAGTALVHRTEVAALLTDAMQQHGDAITLHYSARFTGADFDSRTASFEIGDPAQEAAEKLKLPFELLVGADGAMSAVRACLLQTFPSRIQLTMLSPSDGRVYKAFHGMPPDPQALLWNPGHAGTDAEAAAAAAAGHPPAAGRPSDPGICFNVFATRNPGIGISVSFDVDQGTYSGSFPMLEHLLPTPPDSEAAWLAWLDAVAFPQLPRSWRRALAAQLAAGPVSRIAHVQRASCFTVPGTGAVLIGDAAHTVTPALGQGINSALEDAVLLAQALQGCSARPDDVDAALQRFSATRLPQIIAMQLLELSIRALSAPLLEGTWLGKLVARLRGQPAEQPSLFGETQGTVWLRLRFVLYFIGKVCIASVLRLVLGRRRAHAWLPWMLKGPPMIEVQMGEVDYVTMVRLLDLYGLVMSAAAALGLLVLIRALTH